MHDSKDDHSLHSWIDMVQTKAETLTLRPETNQCPRPGFALIEPFESEVTAVIQQMEAMLCDGNNVHNDIGLDFQSQQEDDPSLAFDFQFKPNYLESIRPSVKRDNASFSTDQIVVLLKKSQRERVLRQCLRALSLHCQQEKRRLDRTLHLTQAKRSGKILGLSFLLWKNHCRMLKVKEAALVLKFGRCTSAIFRQAFASWKQIATSRISIKLEVLDRHRLKTLKQAYVGWNQVSRSANVTLTTIQEQLVRKSKARFFLAWRGIICKIRKQRESIRELADQTYTARLLRMYFRLWVITSSEKNSCNKVIEATKKASDSQPAENLYKENAQPNVILRPLNVKKRAPSFKSPTPKLVLDMEARRIKREQSRGILKLRQEEKQRLRKEQEDRKRTLKEENELQRHNAYLRQRAEEEKDKQIKTARRKQALRLANLHYKLSLCRRVIKQWAKIFQLISFNERKAYLAWCDLTREKCFKQWIIFKDDRKRRRLARMVRCVRLAEGFNERRLLTKAFAAWEVETNDGISVLHEASQKYLQRQQCIIYTAWYDLTTNGIAQRNSKEIRAKQFGRRLCLRLALHQWRFGAAVSKKEREIEELVKAKRKEVYSWLGDE